MAEENTDFSKILKELRSSKGLSLRKVEKKIGISNAYLSQLENGKISQPSPHILHKLSEVYNTSYNGLMKLAGYIKSEEGEKVKENTMADIAFSAIEDLTLEEKEAVIDYIKFLRSKRSKK